MPSFRKVVKRVVSAKLIGLYHLSHETALDEWGWYASFKKGSPCDKEGRPIPWISYPATALLAARVSADWNIFEFGAGYSTLWWGARCRTVTSCEHDATWCQILAPQLRANCSLLSTPLNDAYPLAAQRTEKTYDVIVVDGRKRVRSALASVECLTKDGVLVWDDSERDYYQDGLARLRDKGFKRLDLLGMSPLERRPKQTSVLYRSENVLAI
jgi:hypothetical protein